MQRVADCIANCVCLRVPQPTKWHGIGKCRECLAQCFCVAPVTGGQPRLLLARFAISHSPPFFERYVEIDIGLLAKQDAKSRQSDAITPMQSVAVCMQERAHRHVARMAGVTDKVLPHLEAMPPKEILDRAEQLDRYDRVARRNYGLDKTAGGPPSLNVAVLVGAGRTIIRAQQSTDGTGGVPPEKTTFQDPAH